MTCERCPGCGRPKLYVHGVLRCCNVGCPGDPQTRLDIEPPFVTTTKAAT